MKNLVTASNQWANRPDDERYWTISDCWRDALDEQQRACTATVDSKDLSILHENGELYVNGKTSQAKLTNWSFSQLCARAGAPAGYLTTLSDSTASLALQEGLRNTPSESAQLLLRRNDNSLDCRAITSPKYGRIWNVDLLDRAIELEQKGWKVPPARPAHNDSVTRLATETDVLRNSAHPTLGIKVGDTIAPSGIYLSDRDCFIFLVEEEHPIEETPGKPMYRGVMLHNSEVGAYKLRVTRFYYVSVCGNHIVWDVSNVSELEIIHRANANSRFDNEFYGQLKEYVNESENELVAKIERAKSFSLGSNKEEVLNFIFGKKLLTRKETEACYEQAVLESDLHHTDPTKAWGYVQGITSYSQTLPYTDARTKLDRVAGKIMEVAF